MPWMNKTGDLSQDSAQPRDLGMAVGRGARLRCPCCGRGALFSRFTTVVPACSVCGEDMTPQRADDAPPYIIIVILGHILVAGALALERGLHPPLWLHFSIWLPLTIVTALALLPPVKGAIIGFQWANRMHGFGIKQEIAS